MSRLIKRMETPENLKAIREFHPEAKTVSGGIHHMMVEQGRAITTVVRMIQSYGGTINSGQIQEYRKASGIAVSYDDRERDHAKLCTCCGLQPRHGRMLCN